MTEQKQEKPKKKDAFEDMKEGRNEREDKTVHKGLERLQKKYQHYAPLYERKLYQVASDNKNKLKLKIMQFNILADGLSGAYDPKNGDNKAFIRVPRDAIEWTYRGPRICEEMIRNSPDIIILEECDTFDWIKFYLTPWGYDGIHRNKEDSPCGKVGRNNGYLLKPDGIAIFYRKWHFDLIEKFTFDTFEKGDKPNEKITALSLHLRSKNGQKDFLATGCHLKSTKSKFGEYIRLLQLNYLLPELEKIQSRLENNLKKKVPVFLCCDLNTVPRPKIKPSKDKNEKPKTILDPWVYKSIINGDTMKDEIKNQKVPVVKFKQKEVDPSDGKKDKQKKERFNKINKLLSEELKTYEQRKKWAQSVKKEMQKIRDSELEPKKEKLSLLEEELEKKEGVFFTKEIYDLRKEMDVIRGGKIKNLENDLVEFFIQSDLAILPESYIPNYGLNFSSSYGDAYKNKEPSYTTWKERNSGVDKHTIDYIFYQKHKNVQLINVLEIPDESRVTQATLLPGWDYPSDHFAIMATFNL